MSEPRERCVCDITLVVRTRLLCGLYNRRAVSPRWRRLAQAYCLAVILALLSYSYFILWTTADFLPFLRWFINIFDYILAILISLWTGDEYVNTFFTLNEITDITLDSRIIFNRLLIRIKKSYIFAVLPYAIAFFGINIVLWYNLGITTWMTYVFPAIVLEVWEISGSSTKLLIMALFNARLLVLKRRLLRYGFRAAGLRQPQPYCQIYNKVLQGLEATANPLKAMLFFDLIIACCKIIVCLLNALIFVNIQDRDGKELFYIFLHTIMFTKLIICSFGHVSFLESAAAHCQDMTVFTTTQLIKTPTAEERQRMRSFLTMLECSDARYRVLRALTLDARLVLVVLSFCSAQVVVLAKTVTSD